MALVQISQAHGRIPVTVFQLQDRINLGNYQELEQTAKDAYDSGMRDSFQRPIAMFARRRRDLSLRHVSEKYRKLSPRPSSRKATRRAGCF